MASQERVSVSVSVSAAAARARNALSDRGHGGTGDTARSAGRCRFPCMTGWLRGAGSGVSPSGQWSYGGGSGGGVVVVAVVVVVVVVVVVAVVVAVVVVVVVVEASLTRPLHAAESGRGGGGGGGAGPFDLPYPPSLSHPSLGRAGGFSGYRRRGSSPSVVSVVSVLCAVLCMVYCDVYCVL